MNISEKYKLGCASDNLKVSISIFNVKVVFLNMPA